VERRALKQSVLELRSPLSPSTGIVSVVRSNSGICPMAAEEEEEQRLKLLPHDSRPSFGLSVSWPRAPCTGRLSLIPKSPEKVHHRHLLVGGSPLSIYDGRIMRNRLCSRRFVDKRNRRSFLSFRSWIAQGSLLSTPAYGGTPLSARLLSMCARASRSRSAYYEYIRDPRSRFRRVFVRSRPLLRAKQEQDRVPNDRVPGEFRATGRTPGTARGPRGMLT